MTLKDIMIIIGIMFALLVVIAIGTALLQMSNLWSGGICKGSFC